MEPQEASAFDALLDAFPDAQWGIPRCNTGGSCEISHSEVLQEAQEEWKPSPDQYPSAGIDDATVVFDFTDSTRLGRIPQWAEQGTKQRGGMRMTFEGERGVTSDIWAPHVAYWYASTRRLHVQLKDLGGKHTLLPLDGLSAAVNAFQLRQLASANAFSYLPVKVTRLDVAVDLWFEDRVEGRRMLDALHLARYSGGLSGSLFRDTTVYIRPDGARKPALTGVAYCRGSLHRNLAKPYEWIRLEAKKYYRPFGEAPSIDQVDADFCGKQWEAIFMKAQSPSSLQSVPGEALTMTILERVKAGELGSAAGERLRMYLELERLGVADEYYTAAQLRERRKEARKYGLTLDDAVVQSIDFALGEILARASSTLGP